MNDTTPPSLAVARRALIRHLEPELIRRDIVLDGAQAEAFARLQRLYDELVAFKKARQTLLRWLSPPVPPRGVYFWGGVGRGKSFLMDAFYAAVPLRRTTRVHFHAFMRGVHELLKQWLDVIEVDGGTDYRLRELEHAACYYTPLSDAVEAELTALFERMRPGPDENPRLSIEARTLKARKRAGSLVWFDFAALCEGPRSQLDYREVARRF